MGFRWFPNKQRIVRAVLVCHRVVFLWKYIQIGNSEQSEELDEMLGIYTAVSRKVVGKCVRDNTERICG